MLKIISVFAASDGRTFKTEDEAKGHEIHLLWDGDCKDTTMSAETMGDWVAAHSKEIIAILTDKPVANPRKPRKDKGTTRVKTLPEAA